LPKLDGTLAKDAGHAGHFPIHDVKPFTGSRWDYARRSTAALRNTMI